MSIEKDYMKISQQLGPVVGQIVQMLDEKNDDSPVDWEGIKGLSELRDDVIPRVQELCENGRSPREAIIEIFMDIQHQEAMDFIGQNEAPFG